MRRKESTPLTPGQKFFFTRIFPLIFVVAGIAGLYFGVKAISKAKESLDWPAVKGKIISSSVERSTRRESTRRSKGRSRTRIYYHANISYEYSVDGKDYEGSQVRFGGTSSQNSGRVNSIVKEFPAGKEISVYYEPENPSESILIKGVNPRLYAGAGTGGLFMVIGIAMAIFLPIAAKKQEEKDGVCDI